MKTLIVILGLCLYKTHSPKDLEKLLPPDYRYTEVKRKVGKRKKGVPLKGTAPYLINSSINGRKVNTFIRQSQVNKNNFKINA
jgi:hypothetical protein